MIIKESFAIIFHGGQVIVSNLVHLCLCLFPHLLYLHRFVETKRYMDFVSPGSQAQADFFGVEAMLEGLEPG